MEEVWKDINLQASLLHDHHSTTTTLQDFLATPFLKVDHPLALKPASNSSSSAAGAGEITFLGSLPPTPPEPAGILNNSATSSSGIDFGFLLETNNNTSATATAIKQTSTSTSHSLIPSLVVSYNDSPSHTLPSSSLFPANSNKTPQDNNAHNSTDRRHKRMIKNRESAARSRARKQEKPSFPSLSLSLFLFSFFFFCFFSFFFILITSLN